MLEGSIDLTQIAQQIKSIQEAITRLEKKSRVLKQHIETSVKSNQGFYKKRSAVPENGRKSKKALRTSTIASEN